MATKEVKQSEEKSSPQTWSRSIKRGDSTEEIEVTEVQNGFVVNHRKSGYKGKGSDKQWYCDNKQYISKENPLDEEEDKSFSEALGKILHEIDEQNGQIDVD